MDALALLCNLHADGPATLQRLRRIGCDSIDAVAKLDDLKLGAELRQGEGAARRFKREAHNLLVRQEGGKPMAEPQPEPQAAAREAELTLEPVKLPGMSHILEAWRKMDEEQPPLPPSVYVRKHPPTSHGAALGLASVEGIGPDLLKRLGELGIRSVGELLEVASLALSRSLPLPLTRVRHLQLMARRLSSRDGLPKQGPRDKDLLPVPLKVLRPAVQAFETPEVRSGDASKEAQIEAREPEREPKAETIELHSGPRQEKIHSPQSPQAPSFGQLPGDLAGEEDPDLDRLDSSGPFA